MKVLFFTLFIASSSIAQHTQFTFLESEASDDIEELSEYALYFKNNKEGLVAINPSQDEEGIASIQYSNDVARRWESETEKIKFQSSDNPSYWSDENGNLNVVSGQSHQNGRLGEVQWIYDLESKESKEIELPTGFSPRSGAAMCQNTQWDTWIFGGQTRDRETRKYEMLNDLWVTKDGEWKQIEIRSDIQPQPRSFATIWEAQNSIFVYGGLTQENGLAKRQSDMWQLHLETQVWEEIRFDISNKSEAQKAFSNFLSPQNHPSKRHRAQGWVTDDEHLWLYGGQTVYSEERIQHDSALWKFNIEKRLWTFYPITFTEYLVHPKLIYQNEEKQISFVGCSTIVPFKGFIPSSQVYTLTPSER